MGRFRYFRKMDDVFSETMDTYKFNLLNLYDIDEALKILELRQSLSLHYKPRIHNQFYLRFGCVDLPVNNFTQWTMPLRYWNINTELGIGNIRDLIELLRKAKEHFGPDVPLYKVPNFKLGGGI